MSEGGDKAVFVFKACVILETDRKSRIIYLIILLLFFTFPVQAQEIDVREAEEESFQNYVFKTLPRNLLVGTKESLWGWNLAALGIGAGAAITLSQSEADDEVQDVAEGSLGDFSNIGDVGGDGFTLAGIALSTYVLGEMIDDEKVTETGKALIESQIIRAVMTKAIKLSIGRERPDGRRDRLSSSFPSGHASGSFALASTVDVMYGHKIGIPLYVFAGFVGLSRLSDNKHFLSDVLFGAALGTVIGREVASIHKKESYGKLSLLPYSDESAVGLMLTLSW